MPILKNKKYWFLFGLLVVLIILVILIIIDARKKAAPLAPAVLTNTQDQSSEPTASSTNSAEADKFKAEVPKDIKVPTVNEVVSEAQKKEIAIPTVVVPAAPGVVSSFRNFNISGEGGKFVPSKVIAKLGDTIHINFIAVDRDYDIVFPSYNMRQTAKQGQKKVLEFQALAAGDFLYYCEVCGGPDSAATGHIIVVK